MMSIYMVASNFDSGSIKKPLEKDVIKMLSFSSYILLPVFIQLFEPHMICNIIFEAAWTYAALRW